MIGSTTCNIYKVSKLLAVDPNFGLANNIFCSPLKTDQHFTYNRFQQQSLHDEFVRILQIQSTSTTSTNIEYFYIFL